MGIDTIRLYLEISGYVAGVASVFFLAFQLKKDRKLKEYNTLRQLEEKYTELLWKGGEVPGLNKVWEKMSAERRSELDALKKEVSRETWLIWEKMDDNEKNCYRFTRSGFEILEQAFIATKNGWVDGEIQHKWKHWALSWKASNSFAPYVLAEMDHWFTPSFIRYYNSLK